MKIFYPDNIAFFKNLIDIFNIQNKAYFSSIISGEILTYSEIPEIACDHNIISLLS